ncbi:Hsp20 family protein [Halorubrum sp. CBA1125]|uniref:Hsp20/alpha crystallin family protein n=1 Tax=Halorubrum sp. CBA1125 TaxID=2668072 RepID=UPI0012E712B3|nr:Hsp20/alpha crystallin family protein [Halorubrum sp. CBA1125]MUW15982.1 Hsp20 family protein [Halorubrum sp. CBA1125]
MTRRDPFNEIEALLERMGREFEELSGTLDTADSPATPPLPGLRDVDVDVVEDDEAVTVVADLPGFDDDEIEVELREDALTIAATREEERDVEPADEAADDDVQYHRRERRTRAVSRRVTVPAPVDRDAATASYDNGVLTVTLPKRSETDDGGHSIDID